MSCFSYVHLIGGIICFPIMWISLLYYAFTYKKSLGFTKLEIDDCIFATMMSLLCSALWPFTIPIIILILILIYIMNKILPFINKIFEVLN